ncbi:MAG: hypothetical protein HYV97_01970 [Bdellovibrio sp.]|nr:hypothetical protein [Bdellovibrio sp.]
MKKILIGLAILGNLINGAMAQTQNILIFEDKVLKVNERADGAEVLFKKHAARYKVVKDNDHSLQLIEDLKASIGNKQIIKVEVEADSKIILKIKKDE